MTLDDMVSTPQLARQLGVSLRTVQRWIAAGQITSELRTAGGHYRWNVPKVREQLRSLRERDE